MHIGIPVTNKKPGMVYNEDMKLWMSNPEDYDYVIEYLKFEEGTPFPEILHHNPHVAYKVDDLEHYIEDADQLIFDRHRPAKQPDWLSSSRTMLFWNYMKKNNQKHT